MKSITNLFETKILAHELFGKEIVVVLQKQKKE